MTHDPQVTALLQEAMRAQSQGDPQAAEAACRKALTIEPQNPDAMQFPRLICRHSGRLEEGEKLMRASLQINPNQPHPWNNLGNLLSHQGRDEEALELYRKAISLNKDYQEAWRNLGLAETKLGLLEEARKSLGTALELNPGDVHSLYGYLSDYNVKPGEWVRQGDPVAFVGDTGSLSGPCLYFEIRVEGAPVNPESWLDPSKKLAGSTAATEN